jgi:pimeloyl-ACP methyl ester carboxylesterase
VRFEDSPNSFKPRIIHKVRYGQDKFILLKNQRVHYIDAGEGDALVLLPGSYITYRIWNRLLPLLATEYRVLAPEFPGGLPGKAIDLTLPEQEELILQFLAQLNLEKVILLGGLKGGGTIFDLAARYPRLVQAIIAIEGGLIQSERPSHAPKNALLKHWDRLKTVGRPRMGLEEEARSIRCPLLYLYGTGSDYKTIQLERNVAYLKSYLPHSWIVAIEGSIQSLSRSNPQEIAELILDFLRTSRKQQAT